MIILGYVGNHAKDSLLTRAGWAITRLVQRGRFKRVTHVEGYFGEDDAGHACIASASLRDGGVRAKFTYLDPANWVAVGVPGWNENAALDFILDREGKKYDLRGAVATVLLGRQDPERWFCNELIGAAVGLESPEIFGPAQFMTLALSMPGAKIVPVPSTCV